MNESGHIPITDIASSNSGLNEDTMKIIEASTIVEESMKDKFPDTQTPSTTIQTTKTEASLL